MRVSLSFSQNCENSTEFTQSLISDQMKPKSSVCYSSSINWSAIFVLFIGFWTSVGSLPPTPRNIIEVQALMAIKSLLTDPLLVLQSWDTNSEDPCTWKGITCSDDAHTVTRLVIPSQHLSGTLSPSFVNLTNLEFIALQNNSISGRIPAELGKLPKLQNLDISMNSFSGEIPSELSHLGNLQNLRLNNNNLSGHIPPSLETMAQLVFLDLSFNNLSPPLPKLHAATTRYVGNPLICPSGHDKECSIVRQRPATSSINNSSNITNTTERQQKSSKLGLALGTTLSCGFLLTVGLGYLVWWRRRRHNNQQVFFDSNDQQNSSLAEMSNFGNLRKFEFRELQKATNNFSSKNLVGKGGSGNVYKGYLRDGTVVAVKRLIRMNGGGGEVQFQTEVEMISLAVHRNLLKLLGFCMTHTGERLLVYPYMSNGSIASRLKSRPTLGWSTRKRIALGTARGLLYLHEQCDPKILHRDVKAANVLLDEECEAVVGDFGLAKLLDHRESHVTTAVRGTAGHIAPEYLSTGQSSEKTDVFGFGVLLLELISGQRAIDYIVRNKPNHHHQSAGGLLDWVRKLEQEKKLEMLVDKHLNDLYDRSELEEMVRLALLCTQQHPSLRPNMSQVVRILQGSNPHLLDAAADQSSWPAESSTGAHGFSHCPSDLTDDSSLLVQDMELSGPR